jgi:hypothetical protein
MKQTLLHGEGTYDAPYWITGYRQKERGSIKGILKLCDNEGIEKINIVSSGRYYLRKPDGWYLTSDTVACDMCHGLPLEGRKIK